MVLEPVIILTKDSIEVQLWCCVSFHVGIVSINTIYINVLTLQEKCTNALYMYKKTAVHKRLRLPGYV